MAQRHINDKHLSLSDIQLSTIYNNIVFENGRGLACPA